MTIFDEQNPNIPAPEETQPQGPDYKELYLRITADMQNMKRRVEKERLEWTGSIQSDLLEKLLPVVEDLDRAIETSQTNNQEQAGAWLDGFVLIAKNLKKTFAELGVEEIKASGVFNPELHEALMRVENTERPSGHIVQQLSKGYTFKGKVLKPARVSVAQ